MEKSSPPAPGMPFVTVVALLLLLLVVIGRFVTPSLVPPPLVAVGVDIVRDNTENYNTFVVCLFVYVVSCPDFSLSYICYCCGCSTFCCRYDVDSFVVLCIIHFGGYLISRVLELCDGCYTGFEFVYIDITSCSTNMRRVVVS